MRQDCSLTDQANDVGGPFHVLAGGPERSVLTLNLWDVGVRVRGRSRFRNTTRVHARHGIDLSTITELRFAAA